MARATPMMDQYRRIKSQNEDCILLFRLGDFYEMFEGDAREASVLLSITLTSRNGTPMCGFPFHASQGYIGRLLKAGRKVAICEQVEDPALARGIVRREVVEVLSPGVIINPELLPDSDHNGIASIFGQEESGGVRLSLASLDVSTGDFGVRSLRREETVETLLNGLDDGGVREVLYPDSFAHSAPLSAVIEQTRSLRPDLPFRSRPAGEYGEPVTSAGLRDHFGVTSLDVFEIEDALSLRAAGQLLLYLRDSMKSDLSHIKWVRGEDRVAGLYIDNTTKKHLELALNEDGGEEGTLLSIIDGTKTAMGRRMLRGRLNNPSRDADEISRRLDRLQAFYDSPALLGDVQRELRGVLDVERILSKLAAGKGDARDLRGIGRSLQAILRVKERTAGEKTLHPVTSGIADFTALIDLIEGSIVEDPPPGVREGGFIREGCDSRLDEYRKAGSAGREWMNRYQAEEQEKHGIGSLKVRYNRIIGYYIEVTKPNLHLVPDNYIKKQTLVNAARFTTEKLERQETLIAEARDRQNQLELEIFERIREKVLDETSALYEAAGSVADLDVSCSLAQAARENGYVRPHILEENVLAVREGRHPVVERLVEEPFVGNDLELDDDERRIMILTGPNMSGKSTYLRQCALIIILAQMGGFVPAREARIGLVDRIFSRIGASDRLAKGQSTFLVEMIETARILHYATERSFIIMDEIGRGTSTYDGLSIAWAVLEYLERGKRGAKVLFATHYHEITALRSRHGVVNYTATVREWNNTVLFLRRIVPGSASKSYGIEVARMAGIPDQVIERAKAILSALEMKYGENLPLIDEPGDEEMQEAEPQYDLFPSPYEILLRELRELDIVNLTPLEALNILDRLKKSISF
jgi:DNA mismatch repair protein MutS